MVVLLISPFNPYMLPMLFIMSVCMCKVYMHREDTTILCMIMNVYMPIPCIQNTGMSIAQTVLLVLLMLL